MFTGLPQTPKPWKSVACSFLLQALGLLALIAIGLLPHQELVREKVSSYVPLTAPTPEVQQPEVAHTRPVVTPKVAVEPPPVVARLSVPSKRVLRELEPVRPPEVKLQTEAFVPVAPREVRPEAPRVVEMGAFATQTAAATPVPASKQLETGGFSTGSSATPTTKLPAAKVQTGGFGDPNGVPASGKGRSGGVQIAKVGGFDLPEGPGTGNGTGGATGQRGVVASSGFGNGVATSTPGKGGPRTTQAAGFGEAQAAATAPQPVRRAAAKTPDITGVEILHKPSPQYTDEARKRRIEGEVLIEVVFTAAGDLQIVKVVRGLGYGLDEAAVRAAERVRFKPATREGQPIDSRATLHIVFQLA